MTLFGPNMKARRIALGLTLRDVEAITESAISNAYLSQLENGKIKSPSARIVVMLCAVYSVSHTEALQWLGISATFPPVKVCGECGRPMPPQVLVDAPAPTKRCFTHCGDACDCGAAEPPTALASPAQEVDETERLRKAVQEGIDQLHWINAQAVNIMEATNHVNAANEDVAVTGMIIDSMASDIGVNAMMLCDKLSAALAPEGDAR